MSDAQIEAARVRVEVARNRLTNALSDLKRRLMPGTIARNVAHGLAEKSRDAAGAGADAVKARPAVAVGVAALAALFFARKPIARAIGVADHETPDVAARSAAETNLRKADR